MTEAEYLQQRVENQIKWYDKKSASNKRWFIRLKIIETILALLVPLLAGYIGEANSLKIILGIVGVIVALSANLITIYKLQENWIQFRSVAESLKHEKFLYLTHSGPYKNADSFASFVERFESYISKENTQWAAYLKPKQTGQ